MRADSAGQAEARSCWPLQAMVRNLDFILSEMGRGDWGHRYILSRGIASSHAGGIWRIIQVGYPKFEVPARLPNGNMSMAFGILKSGTQRTDSAGDIIWK